MFSAGSSSLSVLMQGSYLAVSGITIGRVTTNSSGTLKLTFSAAATQTLVNQAISGIAYSNTSDGPPASVQIDWTFNDGNTGSQGAGDALSTTGSTTVNITAINDAPTLANPLADMKLVAGQTFSQQVPATTFSDPDGETLTYTATSADGTGLPPWLVFNATTRTFSGTPDPLDVGGRFDVRVSARDASGATASDVFTVQVNAPNNAPTASNRTLTATEDTARTLTVADFGFSDVDAGNTLQSVTLTRLSSAGILKLNGTAVTLNQVISATDISTGKLVFTPAANANGTAYANWGFKVSDGTALSASDYTMTVNVSAVNDTPTGSVTITGTATQGQTLTAANTLADADGLGGISYQWLANGNAITGATGSTLTLAQAHVGKSISVQASYIDGFGFAESTTSSATMAVANVNDAPTASNRALTATEDTARTLTVADFGFADADTADSLHSVTITRLSSAGSLKLNGTAVTLNQVISAADIGTGKLIFTPAANANGTAYANWGCKVSDGIALSASDYTMTVNVTAVNDAPTGSVTITGTANQGQTLTATNTLADTDGLGSISYQWLANGNAITGATGSTLTLAQAHVGKAITVQASYTDGGGTAEAVTSSATSNVQAANTAPSFNTSARSGIASVDMGEATTMALQGDGKVLLGGYSGGTGWDFSVVKLNADGGLDTSFSGDGKAVIDVGGYRDQASSMVVQSDGKVVLGGISTNSSSGTSSDFSVMRLNADGSLDTTFSGDGKAVIDVGDTDVAYSMAVQSDGKVLLGGGSYSGNWDFCVVRLNADGSLDTGFSGDGKAVIDVGGTRSGDEAYSMVVQSDGKVVPGGSSTNSSGTSFDFSVVRLNADGSLDTGFSGDGKAVIDMGGGGVAYSVVVQSDGKMVLGGYSRNSSGTGEDFSVVRLNADGSLDSSFSGDGKAVIQVSGSRNAVTSMVVQSDGKVVLGGYSTGSDGWWDFSLARLNTDGSLDTSFNGDGKAVIDAGGNDYAKSIAVQSDGKFVLSGIANGQGAAVRLNADGSLDTAFGALATGGIPVNTLGGSVAYTENAAPVVLDSSVQITDAELATLNGGAGNYAGASITLARAGGANAQDVFSAGSGSGLSVLAQGSYLAVNGTTIGRVTTNSGGTLKLTFSSAATQTLVNQALSSIAYSNTSDGPPASVQIDWTFNDGNTGSQGAGDALSTTGSTTVNITAINDGPPALTTALADLRVVAGQAFSHQVPVSTFTDPDGIHTLTYAVTSADGTGLPPWLVFDATTRTFSGTPDTLDLGMSFDVRLSARDTSGATASDVFTVQVNAPNNAPTASNRILTATEDTARTLTVADFGFSDVDAGNTLQSVTITRLSSAGSLKLNGTAVTLNQVISAADIGTGKLVFTPAANANGTAYANWGFKVSDGIALSASDYTMTVNVTAVRDDLTKTGTAGNDTLSGDTIDTGSYDSLSGLEGNDNLSGLAGNDTLDGGAGADSLDGGSGVDTTSYADATTPVSVILYGNQAFGVSSGNDTLTGIENIQGSAWADLVYGDAADNLIDGGAGHDTLDGAEGHDTLQGQTGDDLLNGLAGNDSLEGGEGNDSLYGWADNDNLVGGVGTDHLFGGAGADRLDGGADADQLEGDDGADTLLGGAGNDTLRGWNDNDSLDGGDGDNALFGGAGADSMQAGSGADQLEGDDGNDTIAGGTGNDTLRGWNDNDSISGDDGDDLLVGWSGNDAMNGGAGNDQLFGDDGADTLVGGAGGDVLQGGLGNDVYTFATGFGFDGVKDYDYTAGNSDTFQFNGVNLAELSFAKVGDALKVECTASGGADVIYVNDWYMAGSNGAYKIESWIMGDGTYTAAQIEALV